MQGTIFNIKRFALHDGPGIRTTVFFKGCKLGCWWCHNPESQEPGVSGDAGRIVTVPEVMKEIEKEIIFYDQSGGGVTFSGGEPFLQPDFLGDLLEQCQQKEIHTAVDTTGCVPAEEFQALAGKVNLFLYDLKILDDNQHLKYTGFSNRHGLENLEWLSHRKSNIMIRYPLVPGMTDTEENIMGIGSFVSGLDGVHDIEVLPYHKLGSQKYRKLGLENKMEGIEPPSPERIETVKKMFAGFGLNVMVRG